MSQRLAASKGPKPVLPSELIPFFDVFERDEHINDVAKSVLLRMITSFEGLRNYFSVKLFCDVCKKEWSTPQLHCGLTITNSEGHHADPFSTIERAVENIPCSTCRKKGSFLSRDQPFLLLYFHPPQTILTATSWSIFNVEFSLISYVIQSHNDEYHSVFKDKDDYFFQKKVGDITESIQINGLEQNQVVLSFLMNSKYTNGTSAIAVPYTSQILYMSSPKGKNARANKRQSSTYDT